MRTLDPDGVKPCRAVFFCPARAADLFIPEEFPPQCACGFTPSKTVIPASFVPALLCVRKV
ncbi:MAG: hypothetical protein L6W00_16190 [Lentisphaeria bacterium]|nr:MAG: hypothetical protein L6W00_16190 [Lentisphaeria bacterium]